MNIPSSLSRALPLALAAVVLAFLAWAIFAASPPSDGTVSAHSGSTHYHASVSNLGNSASGTRSGLNNFNSGAIAFTAGDAPTGYTLTKITAKFQAKQSHATGFSAKLHNANGAIPGTQRTATFSGNDPATAGNHEFTCSGAGCTISANTTYFIVLSGGNAGSYYWADTTDTSETNVPSNGTLEHCEQRQIICRQLG